MITLKDIAKEVGLNVSVVSRALNPKPDKHAIVAEETKRLVLETATRLGYQRNRAAEFLKKGKAATIGVFLPAVPNRLIADLMIGISEKAASLRFPLNFFFGVKLIEYRDFFASVNDASHSGLITYPFHDEIATELGDMIDDYRNNGGQIIVLNTDEKYQKIPVLRIDDRLGGRAAAEELVETGCQTFLVDKHYPERARGCCEYLASHGMTGHCFQRQDFNSVFSMMSADEVNRPLGIFATTDLYALELYSYMQMSGFTIGKEVRIVGYDDLALTEAVTPSLSTIHQPFREQGERAVEKLINMIYGKVENDEIIKPWLVKRQSTGCSLAGKLSK